MSGPVLLVVGPPDHGVTRMVDELVAAVDQPPLVLRVPDPSRLADAGLLDAVPAGTPMLGLQFTDRLYGDDCAVSAEVFVTLADRIRAERGAGVTVTLHDLPMTADDPGRYRRRAAAYARVVRASDRVVVASEHEAALLLAIAPEVQPAIVPLPLTDPLPGQPRPVPDHELTVLGFLYPGKGYEQALAALPAGYGLTALGRPADGHDDYARGLEAAATAAGQRITVAGWIPDDQLSQRLRQAALPVVCHQQLSASASISSWLAAGRRPLVPDGAYTRELAERCPGSVTRYPSGHDGLVRALSTALADPDSTWLIEGIRLSPTATEAARRYRAVLMSC